MIFKEIVSILADDGQFLGRLGLGAVLNLS